MKRQERALTAQLQDMLSAESAAPLMNQQLVEVLAEKEQLRSENRTLRQQLGEMHQFHHVVCTELERQKKGQQQEEEAMAKNQETKKHASSNTRDAGYWVTFLEDDPPFYFVPFTKLEWRSISRDTNQSVLSLQTIPFHSNKPVSAVRVVQFFQWCAHLSLEWDNLLQRTMLHFKFCKSSDTQCAA